ncbi:MAG: hypothetical protein RI563_05975 [Thiohalophilus sp.]|uniref:hypothetical protein n=1 Tax=Thiohalophilus sp. TaxID=3028392 RepID=UPI0028701AD6|nr:hypothetical protein [Thiohalophilus sp.]MDR9436406.1 hypothetical protein [Thiohalophilus sp.]
MKPFILQLRNLLVRRASVNDIARGATLLLATLLTPLTLVAEEKYDALYVMSSQAQAYMTFKETIENHQSPSISRRNTHFFVTIDELQTEKLRDLISNSQTVITLGQKSLRNVAALRIDTPHIATLITLEGYREVLSEQNVSQGEHCALVIDQPLHRIARVIRNKLPDVKVAGIIAPPRDPVRTNPGDLSPQEKSLKIVRLPLGKNIHSTIRALSQNGVDAIIALHNKKVYNQSTARNILISSYHLNIPLIGYSSGFVKAGALLGIYSTPESMAIDMLEISAQKDRCHSGNILYPSTYTIEVNPQVAKSLGINIDTSELKQTYQDRPRK